MSHANDKIQKEGKPLPRLDTHIGLKFRKIYERRFIVGSIKNISLTGAFLKTLQHIEVGYKLILKIELHSRIRNISASVVWKNENGYGVQFIKSSNQDMQLIDDLIYFEKKKKLKKQNVLKSILKKVA